MKRHLSFLLLGCLALSACTHTTYVYRLRPEARRPVVTSSHAPLTIPGQPVPARDPGAPASFEAVPQ